MILCGGGGIPVVRKADGSLQGVPAVIDKDLAAAKVAEEIGADILLILTEVDQVAVNFGRPDQQDLGSMTCEEAESILMRDTLRQAACFPRYRQLYNSPVRAKVAMQSSHHWHRPSMRCRGRPGRESFPQSNGDGRKNRKESDKS